MPHTPAADTVVSILVEIQGGPEKWRKAADAFEELRWPTRAPSPKDRRIARRASSAREGSDFRWVDVPVSGSLWRADRRASWQLAQVAKDRQLLLYDRWFDHQHPDRVLEPAWRVYSTHSQARATAPPTAPAWARFLWWPRRALYRAAVGVGWFDVPNQRAHVSSREGALHLARHITTETPRTDVDVRPLDGRGRPGTVPLREDALHRGLVFGIGLVLVMGLFLVLAREAAWPVRPLMWAAAAACAGRAWWTIVTVPMGRTRRTSVLPATVVIAVGVIYALGLPDWFGLRDAYEGVATRDAVLIAALAYYVVGLALLVRRWRWRGVLAGVLPLIAPIVMAALPLTSRFLHEGYADELSLSAAETSVSGLWYLASAVKVLWPILAAVLFLLAAWGILRHFHLVSETGIFAPLLTVILMIIAVLQVNLSTLDSPRSAADELKRAAAQQTAPPPYFGIKPVLMCVTPVVPLDEVTENGGRLAPTKPYISFGVVEGNVVLWNTATDAPLRIPAEQVRMSPAGTTDKGCPEKS